MYSCVELGQHLGPPARGKQKFFFPSKKTKAKTKVVWVEVEQNVHVKFLWLGVCLESVKERAAAVDLCQPSTKPRGH